MRARESSIDGESDSVDLLDSKRKGQFDVDGMQERGSMESSRKKIRLRVESW
jgi:hypothetical protein